MLDRADSFPLFSSVSLFSWICLLPCNEWPSWSVSLFSSIGLLPCNEWPSWSVSLFSWICLLPCHEWLSWSVSSFSRIKALPLSATPYGWAVEAVPLTSGQRCVLWGRYHGPSSDHSFHSPTVIPPLALDKPSIMKRCHRRRTCSHLTSSFADDGKAS